MSEAIEPLAKAEGTGATLRDGRGFDSWTRGSSSRAEILAGLIPFLILVLPTVLYGFVPNLVGFGSFVACYFILLIGLGAAWVRGFPRWSYPYLGLVLAMTFILVSQRDSEEPPIINLLFSLICVTPFLAMLAVVLLKTRSVRPLRQFRKGVWHDWTRLSFAFYGVLPLGLTIAFAATDTSFGLPYLAASAVALIAGALTYMLSTRASHRVSALIVGLTLSWAVATVGAATYWHGRQESWMTTPGNGYKIARGSVVGWVLFLALILAPALLSIFRRSERSVRT